MNTEKIVALNLRLMALGFGAVALVFLLLPNQTLAFITNLGAGLGSFAPADPTPDRFYVSLTFSFMVLVTGLAWIAAGDPAGNRGAIRLLAVGKLASSLSCLYFYLWTAPVFIYLLNFLVDLSLAGVSISFLWILSRPPASASKA